MRRFEPEETAEPQPLAPPSAAEAPKTGKPAHRRVDATASLGRKHRRPPLY